MNLQPALLNRGAPRRAMAPPAPFDRWFLLTLFVIIVMGLVMVASASIVISDQQMHQPFYFFYKQLINLAIGIVMGAIVIQFDIAFWEKISGTLLLVTLFLLALVLFPGVGHSVNGSARWIGIGPLGMQISEMAKFAVIVYMAGYLLRYNEEIQTQLSGFLKPMAIIGVVALLLLKEPDFGATVVIFATTLGMMFLAGMSLRHFILLLVVVLAGLAVVAISEPYRLLRLTSFLNPWAHPFSSGYQLTQSLIAFGRGGWFGVGLGQSVQKLFYLPEAHTDFLFAVIAEEWGFVGVMMVIGLFTFLVMRILFIGQRAQKVGLHYAGFLAYGFALWIAIQFTVSIGVNTGLLPTKGLTLPFMSYGGSSMLVNCITIAVLLRIDYESRMQALGLR